MHFQSLNSLTASTKMIRSSSQWRKKLISSTNAHASTNQFGNSLHYFITNCDYNPYLYAILNPFVYSVIGTHLTTPFVYSSLPPNHMEFAIDKKRHIKVFFQVSLDVKIGQVGRGSIVFNLMAVEWLLKFLVESFACNGDLCSEDDNRQEWTRVERRRKCKMPMGPSMTAGSRQLEKATLDTNLNFKCASQNSGPPCPANIAPFNSGSPDGLIGPIPNGSRVKSPNGPRTNGPCNIPMAMA